jgi:hypothetical protein
MIPANILCDPEVLFMKGQYIAVLVAFITALVNAISVIAYGQNETNGTDIGENQSISGTMSEFRGDLDFGPKIVDDPLKQ